MPALQTTYGTTHARWVEGMVPNMEPNVVVSRLAENAAIGFGKVAVMGDTDVTVRASAASRTFAGFALLDITRLTGQYEVGETVNLLKKGVVVAQASEAVTKGDPVYFTPATGVLGKTASSNTLIAGASWDTSTTGAGLAIVRLA